NAGSMPVWRGPPTRGCGNSGNDLRYPSLWPNCATEVNIHSRKFLTGSCNARRRHSFSCHAASSEGGTMRKLAYAIAALATIAVSAPPIASAEGMGVYVGGDHGYSRARYNGPRVGV